VFAFSRNRRPVSPKYTLKDDAQEDSASLPEPDVIAEDLRAALEQFEAIAADLAPAT
jgi:hypothetical protein